MFADRLDAGNRLGVRLQSLSAADPIVLGIPRGGVPVAAAVARHLRAALDVVMARKVGVPYQPEAAMGAVAEDGVAVLDRVLVGQLGIAEPELARLVDAERRRLDAQALDLRGRREPVRLQGRSVVVVDDGLATGWTAVAACRSVRLRGAASVVFATPVGASDAARRLRAEVDAVLVLQTPAGFGAVSRWYRDFSATSTQDVRELLDAGSPGRSPDQ